MNVVSDKKEKKHISITKLILINVVTTIVLIALFIAGFSLFFIPASNNLPDNQKSDYLSFLSNNEDQVKVVHEESAVIDVVKKVDPAVVSIIVSKDLPVLEQGQYYDPFEDFFNDPFFENFRYRFYRPDASNEQPEEKYKRTEIGGGTGFVISEEGLVVTNKHVVLDEEAQYTILFNNEEKYSAQVLARDPVNDIAVLKITQKEAEGDEPAQKLPDDKKFPVLELGNSDSLQVGQQVISIGNALGEYRNTVSTGIISGLKRNITAGNGNGYIDSLDGVIQTDAAINRGNSGGPLVNITGQVIGVNVAMANGAENIAFSIPINSVKKTIEMVKEKGRLVRPIMGVRYIPVTKSLQEKNNLAVDYGALVIRGKDVEELAVLPGSPADKAGIVEYDILLEINGNKLDEENPLSKEIMKYNVGDEITVKFLHKGEEKTAKLVLVEEIDTK